MSKRKRVSDKQLLAEFRRAWRRGLDDAARAFGMRQRAARLVTEVMYDCRRRGILTADDEARYRAACAILDPLSDWNRERKP